MPKGTKTSKGAVNIIPLNVPTRAEKLPSIWYQSMEKFVPKSKKLTMSASVLREKIPSYTGEKWEPAHMGWKV